MTPKTEQPDTVELLALHHINHDGVAYPPYSILTVNAKDAQRLIESDAAQPSSIAKDVPIEQRAPAGFVAINQTIGQPSSSFMPIAEYKKMREKQYAT